LAAIDRRTEELLRGSTVPITVGHECIHLNSDAQVLAGTSSLGNYVASTPPAPLGGRPNGPPPHTCLQVKGCRPSAPSSRVVAATLDLCSAAERDIAYNHIIPRERAVGG